MLVCRVQKSACYEYCTELSPHCRVWRMHLYVIKFVKVIDFCYVWNARCFMSTHGFSLVKVGTPLYLKSWLFRGPVLAGVSLLCHNFRPWHWKALLHVCCDFHNDMCRGFELTYWFINRISFTCQVSGFCSLCCSSDNLLVFYVI